MSKILSKSGASLADVYDVEGSVAGIDNLESKDVHLVHEMGSTIFTERVSGAIHSIGTGAVAQSTNFNVELSLGLEPNRIFHVTLTSEVFGRLTNATISLTNTFGGGNDIPIWAWVTASGDRESVVQLEVSGTVGGRILYRPLDVAPCPIMAFGTHSPLAIPTVSLRGTTAAFGAGTITLTALIYVGFPSNRGSGLSNYGLPIPSW